MFPAFLIVTANISENNDEFTEQFLMLRLQVNNALFSSKFSFSKPLDNEWKNTPVSTVTHT